MDYLHDPDTTRSCKFNPDVMTPLHFVILMDYLHDPDTIHSCKYNPDVMAKPRHLGFFVQSSYENEFSTSPKQKIPAPTAPGLNLMWVILDSNQ